MSDETALKIIYISLGYVVGAVTYEFLRNVVFSFLDWANEKRLPNFYCDECERLLPINKRAEGYENFNVCRECEKAVENWEEEIDSF